MGKAPSQAARDRAQAHRLMLRYLRRARDEAVEMPATYSMVVRHVVDDEIMRQIHLLSNYEARYGILS